MKTTLEKLKEKDRDLFYKRLSDRTPINPENEPVVGLMEWIDLLDEFR